MAKCKGRRINMVSPRMKLTVLQESGLLQRPQFQPWSVN